MSPEMVRTISRGEWTPCSARSWLGRPYPGRNARAAGHAAFDAKVDHEIVGRGLKSLRQVVGEQGLGARGLDGRGIGPRGSATGTAGREQQGTPGRRSKKSPGEIARGRWDWIRDSGLAESWSTACGDWFGEVENVG